MKKEQREIFKVLTDEIGTELCFFCKFVEYNGCGECCECVHPLIEKMLGLDEWLEPGKDCWLFKNRLKVEDCADLTLPTNKIRGILRLRTNYCPTLAPDGSIRASEFFKNISLP